MFEILTVFFNEKEFNFSHFIGGVRLVDAKVVHYEVVISEATKREQRDSCASEDRETERQGKGKRTAIKIGLEFFLSSGHKCFGGLLILIVFNDLVTRINAALSISLENSASFYTH